MVTKFMIGVLIFAILGGTSSAFSLIPKFGRSTKVVPVSESKKERVIRCKGEIVVDDKGQVVSCSEGFYMTEESENTVERNTTMKEKFLGWLGNFKGLVFWAVLGSIVASMMGFGGIVSSVWTNLFGTVARALKETVRAIARAKRNGGHFMEELDRAHSAHPAVQKKINEIRAKVQK